MSALGLKDYQQRALDVLSEYLQLAARIEDDDTAFYQTTRKHFGQGVMYRSAPSLPPGMPYVCLRVPTGGGKTVMACHSISRIAENWLKQERCVVLWLVPTNTIKDQTLNALRDRAHPYRMALEATLTGGVAVMDLTEALYVQPSTLDTDTTIIVSTMAALRVEDTLGRRVYSQDGALMAHFDNAPAASLVGMETYTDGKPIPSLANVLRLHRPVVIVDEAHNARTELSFETLGRFRPACVLELTATPVLPPAPNASNVLYSVSAYELKAESMIKLPIHLTANGNWQTVLDAAIVRRHELEALAVLERQETGEYIRPIVLLQAQKRNEDLTIEKVHAVLLERGIAADQIAVEAYGRHDLQAMNILPESCPVRYVLTVDQLREGWDCPFAYVLCSVRDMHSKTAVEQILGRVLRMPKAVRKTYEDLNDAYAFVTSQNFQQAAEGLVQALRDNGFDKFDPQTTIVADTLPLAGIGDGPLFANPTAQMPPAERGETFAVPQLALRLDGVLETLDESLFLPAFWPLSGRDASLSETEFPKEAPGQKWALDVKEGRGVVLSTDPKEFASELQGQLMLLMADDIQEPAQLALWLDRHIRHPDIAQMQAQAFLLRLVDDLVVRRGLSLETLAYQRLRLRDAAAAKIQEHRWAERKKAYQVTLFAPTETDVEVSVERVFAFDPDNYPVNKPYEGPYQFQRHYYRMVGDMNGEEARCAAELDRLPKVRYWVRNLERRRGQSFWLPTSTDLFYPDFVALLEDGRVMAVEYKGADRITNDDTKEKQALGTLWEARSGGKCLFRLVGETDYTQQLQSAVA